jgi:hypothetical protein
MQVHGFTAVLIRTTAGKAQILERQASTGFHALPVAMAVGITP